MGSAGSARRASATGGGGVRLATELLAVALLAVGLVVGWVATAKAKSRAQGKPNIVMVQVDDGVRGDIQHMPYVSKLMRQGGATFTDYNVPYPLCGPARASFLTGQLAHNNQMMSNFEATDGGHFRFRSLPGELNQKNSLGPWMRQAGYRTALIGKYLNEYGATDAEEVPPGWDRWVALLDNSTYDYFNYGFNVDGRIRYKGDPEYAKAHIELARKGHEQPARSFAQLLRYFREVYQPWDYFGSQVYRDNSAIVTGTYAVRFVKRQSQRSKPFFLYYAPPAPHAEDTNHVQGIRTGAPDPDPRPPARYRDAFDDVELPRPPAFNEADVSDKASNVKELPLLSDEEIETIQENFRGRLGALRGVDNQVKRIANALKKRGEFENTYFVFTSDNGYIQGEHRLSASKFMPFENSIRVPAMIAGPGIEPGRTVSGTAMDVDVPATILDIAGAEPGRTLDGLSLLPAAEGGKELPRRDVPLEALRPLFTYSTPLTAFDVPYYGVRTDRYKYVNWSFGEQELYDLRNDPDELQNLAGDPAMAGLMAELEAEASRLRGCVGTADCR